MEDLSIDGPGSPVSLVKFFRNAQIDKPLTLIVDGTGCGIAHDAEDVVYVTPAECSTQAKYYCSTLFNGKNIPAYLYRHLGQLMFDWGYEYKYETDQALAAAFESGELSAESDDYKQICNWFKYIDSNDEVRQIVGLIQLIAGSLNAARKQESGLRLYIDKPETSLHPKRQAGVISTILRLKDEYGYDEEQQTETK